MQEVWKAVPEYEGLYEASTFGNIRSLDRTVYTKGGQARRIKGKILKPQCGTNDPRLQVSLCKNYTVSLVRVHFVIAQTFIGQRPNGMHICHNDGDCTNNHLSNLRYDTPSGNEKDKILHGKAQRGTRCHWHKLNDDQVRQIRELAKQNISPIVISEMFKISRQNVSKIKLGTRWTWLN
jgi:hypothetical protein